MHTSNIGWEGATCFVTIATCTTRAAGPGDTYVSVSRFLRCCRLRPIAAAPSQPKWLLFRLGTHAHTDKVRATGWGGDRA
jgi:hypothetical protein